MYIVSLRGGLEPRQLTAGHQGATHSPTFSTNGRLIAWTEMAMDGYESDKAIVMMYDLESNARWAVTEAWDRSIQEMAVRYQSSSGLVADFGLLLVLARR